MPSVAVVEVSDWVRMVASSAQEVAYGGERMMENHSRAGIAHHLAYALAHIVAVAVDAAVATGGLSVAEGASGQACRGIFGKGLTFGAHPRCAPWPGGMVTAAVDADHEADGARLALDASDGHFHRR